jgi:hypothetical protein
MTAAARKNCSRLGTFRWSAGLGPALGVPTRQSRLQAGAPAHVAYVISFAALNFNAGTRMACGQRKKPPRFPAAVRKNCQCVGETSLRSLLQNHEILE